jgi:hypothetical protein
VWGDIKYRVLPEGRRVKKDMRVLVVWIEENVSTHPLYSLARLLTSAI